MYENLIFSAKKRDTFFFIPYENNFNREKKEKNPVPYAVKNPQFFNYTPTEG